MKKIFRWLIVSVVLVVGLSGLTAYSAPLSSEGTGGRTQVKDPVKVVCENGIMLGQSEEGVISFKGVPFAKPPTGKLRWKAPQAPDPSGDEIRCYDFGYTALQSEWPSEPASYFPKNEDCLTLNIWENKRVMDSEEPKPVMVFFHGGAYGWGGTTDPMYNGQNFAKAHDDVILVTCNYRLGLMAFPDFSKIEGGGDYTDINLALRDQIAALQWIKKNIAGFGGNPDNVTIFGESAGSWSVTALAISPKARGLFRRVIAQSGEMVARDRKEAQKYADFVMKASGAKNMKELLAISGDEWMKLDSEKGIADECCFIVIDEDIIPKDLDKAFEEAAKSGVQMIMGSNSDEWNYFKEDSEGDTEEEKLDAWVKDMDTKYNEAFGDTDKEGKAALEELIKYEESIVPEEYAGNRKVKEALVKSGLVSEMWRYEILDFADRFADAGGDIRVYLWKVPSTRENMYKSAVHAVELAYVFNNLKDDIYAGEVDPGTAAKVQEAWVNFAGTGDPSVKGVLWKKYNTGTRDTMVIEKDKWECVSDPSKKTRELLKKAYGDKPYYVW
ncbi:MAG: carboxylesterase/lipase family protein [Acidaminococcaceae bacterium]|nr:carboxylesterase/lipase family protein [Acidaminococcaceae bacterium]